MGCANDALEEIGVALQQPERHTAARVSFAVSLLFDPRWLRLGLDEALAVIREASFTN